MNKKQIVFEGTNLSEVWKNVMEYSAANGKELSPLVLSMTGFDETSSTRDVLNRHLKEANNFSVETVSETIFPQSLYQLVGYDRKKLYDMYKDNLLRLHKIDRNNRRGLYFERLINYDNRINQLDIIIDSYLAKPNVRRTKLQASVFDPRLDHIKDLYQGFPCLQHITTYVSDDGLILNSFYALQYLVRKAYGNWLGLINLGKFLSKEMGVPFAQFNCFVGIEEREITKTATQKILADINNVT